MEPAKNHSIHGSLLRRRLTGAALALWFCLFLVPAGALGAGAAAESPALFPLPLDSYNDAGMPGLWEILKHRATMEPFNLLATVLFLLAVVHTFFTQRLRRLAHDLAERHRKLVQDASGAPVSARLIIASRILHFFGEVEAVFGIWAVALAAFIAARFGTATMVHYFNHDVNYNEAVFVVVIMAMSATRPVLRLAEQCLSAAARLTGGGVRSWWFAILTFGPLLGSLITEPAAMTISALLLARKFYELKPRPAFAYATLGVLFVNVSIGGTLTHFAAPPVLMVASRWDWGTLHMLGEFGWKAALAIVGGNLACFAAFRKEFAALAGNAAAPSPLAPPEPAVPIWVTAAHVIFMALAVLNAHNPAMLIAGFLFFLAFYEVTEDYQNALSLRPAILVGFFLAGLVVHGGLQQWWIAPVLSRLSEVPLMLGSMGLTAFNDNAAITYLATLVPGLSDPLKYAVVAGAVAGGGLTVIANAPNPAGQAILDRFFPNGISPFSLLLGALLPTLLAAAVFIVFR
ncbi:MAG: putative Na+/H+ antiporter [Verrucomicrobiota bacterium]